MFRNQTWLCALLLVVALVQADQQALRKRDVFQIEDVENKETADFFNAEQRGMMTKEESASSSSSKGKGGKGKGGKGKGGKGKGGSSESGMSESSAKSGKGGKGGSSGKGGSKGSKKSAKKGGKGKGGSKGSKKDRVMDDFEDMIFGSMSMSL